MPQSVGEIPTPLGLVEQFFEHCRDMGWLTGEFLDFVKHDNEYFCFVWIRLLHQRKISEILMDDRSSIFEEGSYGVKKLNYKALIFQEPPPMSLVKAMRRDRQLSRRVAIYDLSPLYNREETCPRLNETGTRVYSEFEDFLRKRFGVILVSFEPE